MEKHFPAPDRNRINKILGISETSKEFKDIIDEVTGKTSKRKPGKASLCATKVLFMVS